MQLSNCEEPSYELKKPREEPGKSKQLVEDNSRTIRNALNSKESSSPLSEGHRCPRGYFKRSKTHDCLGENGPQQAEIPGCRDGTKWLHQHKLVSSISFPGLKVPLRLLPENQDTSGGSREIIDFRNLKPQVPFVPCITKSVPKNRISLQMPRKAIKDLFVSKRHKKDKTISPSSASFVSSRKAPTLKKTKKAAKYRDSTTDRRYLEESCETASDSSSECCANVFEDSASLKSFGSLAGCGEIFADDLASPEGIISSEPDKLASGPLTQSPSTLLLQGGKERLASPANTEVMFDLFETVNRQLQELSKSTRLSTKSTITKSPSTTRSEDITLNTFSPGPNKNKLKTDVLTPKSDHQGSTSDEGYCDKFSPGFEDHSKSSLSPVLSSKIPRDTYSGDALYELFDVSVEAETPTIGCTDLTNSNLGQCCDLPLSMHSFHVGAEENLALCLSQDMIGHELMESKWMGKNCMVKSCQSEISMTMGIVNWLRQRSDQSYITQVRASSGGKEEERETNTRYRSMSAGAKKPPRRTKSGKCRGDSTFKASNQHKVCPSKYNVNPVMSPLSQANTPTSGVCFKILNIDSTLSPGGDLQSPVVSSPSSGTRSLFVLAINKESLCESCKGALTSGAKNLHLCRSCVSFIEHINTSDLRVHSSAFPQIINRDLFSPGSTCGIRSDISIASIVEQCASQFSSMKIDLTQTQPNCTLRDVLVPATGLKQSTKRSQKSKYNHKKIANMEEHGNDRHPLRKPQVFESKQIGFVSNDLKDHFRPTSLPLVATSSSEMSFNKDSSTNNEGSKARKKHNLQHSKNPALNQDESCSVFQGDRRVKRRLKMKK